MKEIVIKLSDVTYERLIESKGLSTYAFMSFAEAVKNGKVLPKGHKELIDTKELIQNFVKAEENMKDNGVTPIFDVHEIINMILSQNVIVEADKGE